MTMSARSSALRNGNCRGKPVHRPRQLAGKVWQLRGVRILHLAPRSEASLATRNNEHGLSRLDSSRTRN